MQQRNGPARIPKASDEAYETLNSAGLGMVICENTSACTNPDEYEWRHRGKREMLVPYNCTAVPLQDLVEASFPDRDAIRWEKHRVWIVEGVLRRGESNVLARRRFYLDEDSWLILLGEGHDIDGTMVKSFVLYHGAAMETGKIGRWYAL